MSDQAKGMIDLRRPWRITVVRAGHDYRQRLLAWVFAAWSSRPRAAEACRAWLSFHHCRVACAQ
eukprot:225302-Alexandrium_andersonii.AAC.1